MITTREGTVKKKGDKVWEIAYNIYTKKYIPVMAKVHISLSNELNAFGNYAECEKECKIKNQLNNGKDI